MKGLKQFELTGRSAIITGGSRGLGAAMAKGLASVGASVLIVARNGDQARESAARIAGETGGNVIGMATDVTDADQVSAMVDRAIGEFGKLDILINNAGGNHRGLIEELTPEDFRRVYEVNATGPWLCTRAAVPHMKERRFGRIINIASLVALMAFPGRSPYSSSKAAVVQLTHALCPELAPWNITVNAISPGPFMTEMNAPLMSNPEELAAVAAQIPLKRWGEVHEMEGAAIFLASDAASFVSGTVISVDGGIAAR